MTSSLPEQSERVTTTVGGFDNGPCYWCAREEPCRCLALRGPGVCVCTCGRCGYPFPLPDDGPDPS